MSGAEAAARTFSESWHRIAEVRAELRPNVRARRQTYRGQLWYVLHDPLNNQFFRVTADAWAFLARLGGDRTVGEVWEDLLAARPDLVLGQEEVVQLLGQLNLSNLLRFDRPGATEAIFERYRKRRQREHRAWLMGFLALRLPLYDPDRLLDAGRWLIDAIYSRTGAVLWALLVLAGLKVAADNAAELAGYGDDLLAPDNLLLLYGGFVIAKVIHEFSHAMACKRFGGEVHVMGIMLILLAPLPYVDASASWGFRNRWQRLLVGAAGMLAEFAVAAVAVMIWAAAAPGVVKMLAYDVVVVASVSTILFNLNPLLRFDGYYMLVDLLDMPNLYQRSREQLRSVAERRLFGLRQAKDVARSETEAVALPVYGAASLAWWGVVIVGIVLLVAERYLGLGVVLAVVLTFLMAVVPVLKFLHYLLFSPALHRHRARAVGVSLGLLLAVATLLGAVELPEHVRAPGVVEAVVHRDLNTGSSGFLEEILIAPGRQVSAGTPLLRLANFELDLELERVASQRNQLLAQEQRAGSDAIADLAPLRRQRAALEARLAHLERQRGALVVRAPISGIWSAPEVEASLGRWIPRGAPLGIIVDEGSFRFTAVLPQTATFLFGDRIAGAEVRLEGQEDVNIVGQSIAVVPFEQGLLPSAALGWAAGGTIAVDSSDPSGLRAREPFFRITAQLPPDAGARLVHGRVGTLRVALDERTLFEQFERRLRQFLQGRFSV